MYLSICIYLYVSIYMYLSRICIYVYVYLYPKLTILQYLRPNGKVRVLLGTPLACKNVRGRAVLRLQSRQL